MNVHAIALATNYYLDNYSEPSEIVPFVSASKFSLTIDGELSNGNLPYG